MVTEDVVQSFVTKSFLINIITRDIGIVEAILELVDNSLDRAVELYGIEVAKSLTEDYDIIASLKLSELIAIDIKISENDFVIEDNCGGISREKLEKEVFIFGHPKIESKYSGLSAFGIGMKRALFKLGKKVDLRTITQPGDESAVVWDIERWLDLGDENKYWSIPFSKIEDSELHLNNKLPGTIIKIEKLNSSVKARFIQPEFLAGLKERLRTSYALFLKSGIKIRLNGDDLTHSVPNFFTSEEINYTSKYWNEADVGIRILAGITPLEDRTPRGWYIFCNGRMVLEADKTSTTGWGSNLPLFHPKFNHFIGFVSFNSANVKALPWSSTKWGVEVDSVVYAVALEEMRLQAIPILNVLDRWKEIKDEDESPGTELCELLKDGATTPVFASAKTEIIFSYTPKRDVSDSVRISFSKDRTLVQKVKESLGNTRMTNPSVGQRVFDYYVESELD